MLLLQMKCRRAGLASWMKITGQASVSCKPFVPFDGALVKSCAWEMWVLKTLNAFFVLQLLVKMCSTVLCLIE